MRNAASAIFLLLWASCDLGAGFPFGCELMPVPKDDHYECFTVYVRVMPHGDLTFAQSCGSQDVGLEVLPADDVSNVVAPPRRVVTGLYECEIRRSKASRFQFDVSVVLADHRKLGPIRVTRAMYE